MNGATIPVSKTSDATADRSLSPEAQLLRDLAATLDPSTDFDSESVSSGWSEEVNIGSPRPQLTGSTGATLTSGEEGDNDELSNKEEEGDDGCTTRKVRRFSLRASGISIETTVTNKPSTSTTKLAKDFDEVSNQLPSLTSFSLVTSFSAKGF